MNDSFLMPDVLWTILYDFKTGELSFLETELELEKWLKAEIYWAVQAELKKLS